MTDIRLERTYGEAKKAIAAELERFNRRHTSASPPKSFAVTLREGERFQGGLMAEGVGDWMYVTLLWVAEECRRQGFGTALLQQAEAAAEDRGAKGILVDTYSFQAPAFYKKHGYTVYGEVDDFPEAGMIWYRLKKVF